MSNDLVKDFANLNDAAKDYLKTKVDLLKVSLLAKMTNFTAALISFWFFATIISWILVFAVAAFVVWYGQTYDNYLVGFLLAIGFLIMILVLFIVFRKSIVTNPVLRNYSKMIFEEDKEDEL